MNKDKVLKIDTCCNYADVTLVHKSGSITVFYKLFLPEKSVVRLNRNGQTKPILVSGNKINTLRDNGQDIAYIYNGHMHLVAAPQNCRDFVKKLQFTDRMEFARVLCLEMLHSKKIPSLVIYKNLQKMLAEYGLTR